MSNFFRSSHKTLKSFLIHTSFNFLVFLFYIPHCKLLSSNCGCPFHSWFPVPDGSFVPTKMYWINALHRIKCYLPHFCSNVTSQRDLPWLLMTTGSLHPQPFFTSQHGITCCYIIHCYMFTVWLSQWNSILSGQALRSVHCCLIIWGQIIKRYQEARV